MKCENCRHVVMDGYEYPEYICELAVPDNAEFAKYLTTDGCSLTKKQRIKRCKELREYVGLWWDESVVSKNDRA